LSPGARIDPAGKLLMKVTLRNVVETDLPVFFQQQDDPEASQMAAFPIRERDAFMAHWHDRVLKNSDGIVKTILVDGQIAGNVLHFVVEGEHDIGYWLGKEYWGRGIATQALAQFIDQVQERPLYAHVAKHNIGSRRVLEKCGFIIHREEKVDEIEEYIMKLEQP
jgi:RimJ/RimL family protein N-acetyltransferase